MSIFISGLAFGQGRALDAAKLAVFFASALAGVLGFLFLRFLVRSPSLERGDS
jgi:Na+/H+ antiporter NhaA